MHFVSLKSQMLSALVTTAIFFFYYFLLIKNLLQIFQIWFFVDLTFVLSVMMVYGPINFGDRQFFTIECYVQGEATACSTEQTQLKVGIVLTRLFFFRFPIHLGLNHELYLR